MKDNSYKKNNFIFQNWKKQILEFIWKGINLNL